MIDLNRADSYSRLVCCVATMISSHKLGLVLDVSPLGQLYYAVPTETLGLSQPPCPWLADPTPGVLLRCF